MGKRHVAGTMPMFQRTGELRVWLDDGQKNQNILNLEGRDWPENMTGHVSRSRPTYVRPDSESRDRL